MVVPRRGRTQRGTLLSIAGEFSHAEWLSCSPRTQWITMSGCGFSMRARKRLRRTRTCGHTLYSDLGQANRRHLPPALRHRHHRGRRPSGTANFGTGDGHRISPDRSGAGCAVAFKTTLRVAEALKLPATQLHEVIRARISVKGAAASCATADHR